MPQDVFCGPVCFSFFQTIALHSDFIVNLLQHKQLKPLKRRIEW